MVANIPSGSFEFNFLYLAGSVAGFWESSRYTSSRVVTNNRLPLNTSKLCRQRHTSVVFANGSISSVNWAITKS